MTALWVLDLDSRPDIAASCLDAAIQNYLALRYKISDNSVGDRLIEACKHLEAVSAYIKKLKVPAK